MGIAVLDPVVADAIAAGEVVERPASVVKELLENSLDAGATRVTIEVRDRGAGVEGIVVSDDGAGIERDELGVAFRRHATSKVSVIGDLERVATLGFRGEALASVAAVARVRCRSTVAGALAGAELTVEYGEVGTVRDAPPVAGTRVEVSGLFENTPARLAFLRKPAAEMAQVTRVVVALGLCHPGVAIRLEVEGRRALDLPGRGDLASTLVAAGISGSLLAVDGAREDFSVAGLIAEPERLSRSRDHLHLAVNGRPVASRSLAFAVEQSYRGLVAPGYFPAGALHLQVPAERVDVNVHPTKREVRFRDERLLFGLLQEACVAALAMSRGYAGSLLGGPVLEPTSDASEHRGNGALADGVLRPYAVGARFAAPPAPAQGTLIGVAAETHGAVPPALLRGPFRLIGQLSNSYILAEGPGGLVLVDQHAAHERITYNRLVAARADTLAGERCQPLLVPTVVHLTPVQSACLRGHLGEMRAAGIEIEEFGERVARITAVDPMLPERGIDRLALDVLDDLAAEDPDVDMHRRLERTTYTVACHSSIRFGQHLAPTEMEALLRDLEVADPGTACPHGRPTMIEISDGQLRREFKRSTA